MALNDTVNMSKPKKVWNNFKTLLRRTSAEVYISAALVATIGGANFFSNEMEKTHHIDLAFSEIRQVEKDSKEDGVEIGPMSEYLMSTSDAYMKIFECRNQSYEMGNILNRREIFARELEHRIDPSMKIYTHNLNDFLDILPELAQRTLDTPLQPFLKIYAPLSKTASLFEKSWDDWHVDHYDTEYYTDSDGETQSREVYSHTTHTYDYDKRAGEEASRKIDKLVAEHPNPKFTEVLRTTFKTNAEGEYAAELSRQDAGEYLNYDPAELLRIANLWADGSTLMRNLPTFYGSYGKLDADSDKWRRAKRTSRDHRYDTYSSSDSGPKEFQVAERALSHSRNAYNAINQVLDGVFYVQQNTPKLQETIQEFIAVQLDGKEGNAKKLEKQLVKMAMDGYEMNFKAGSNLNKFRIGLFGLVLLGYTALGAGAGAIWDKAGDHFNLYGSGRRERRMRNTYY